MRFSIPHAQVGGAYKGRTQVPPTAPWKPLRVQYFAQRGSPPHRKYFTAQRTASQKSKVIQAPLRWSQARRRRNAECAGACNTEVTSVLFPRSVSVLDFQEFEKLNILKRERAERIFNQSIALPRTKREMVKLLTFDF